MNATDAMPPATAQALPALNVVKLYHARSKHRFEAYAQGPGMLDWDAQPAAFRRYVGAPAVVLPLIGDVAQGDADQGHTCQTPDLASIAALLQLALGITAWKVIGPDRWAVRANPSSGNLHPVEAWLITRGIAGLSDGVHHYRPEDHALELRARDAADHASQLAPPQLRIALSTAMWREAWKYGERGFRYCQLDVGHAMSALAHAAAVLGWSMHELKPDSASLAHRLGLDRHEDFPTSRYPGSEHEEAEVLLSVNFDAATPTAQQRELLLDTTATQWLGTASQLDPLPLYHWPLIDDVARATRRTPDESRAQRPAEALPAWLGNAADGRSAASLILGRRSAQRFDPATRMTQDAFMHLLQVLGDRLQHGRLSSSACEMVAALFVHRVDTLEPGLYLFAAGHTPPAIGAGSDPVATVLGPQGARAGLWRIRRFEQVELHRLARSLHCHQDIAANACLALGLLAAFDTPLADDPSAYRDLFRAAGQVGQALYLTAESLGLRGTGIGCFFDDPVHKLLGLHDTRYQSLYHFTIGKPVEDTRMENSAAYPGIRSATPSDRETPTP